MTNEQTALAIGDICEPGMGRLGCTASTWCHALRRPVAVAFMCSFVFCANARGESTSSGYQPLPDRWNEDHADLCKSLSENLLFQLKCIPLGANGQARLSFGGEYRLKVDDFMHPDFGLHHAPSFVSTQQRYFLHADAYLDENLRIFLQIAAGEEEGRTPFPRPGDRGGPDIAQAFVDYSFALDSQPWTLRLGRQEITLGRYITTRDVTNIHRTFDGVRLDGGLGAWTLTALAADVTRNRAGAFNDSPDPHDQIAALLLTHPLPGVPGFKIDLVTLDHDNDAATYAAGTGPERRTTASARAYGGQGPWDIEMTGTYQFGRFTPIGHPPLNIAAWGAAAEVGWTFKDISLTPRFALRADLASGDESSSGRYLNTFDLPYPNLAYLSDAAIFAPRNIMDVQPFVTVLPAPGLAITVGVDFLWRYSNGDAVYSSANLPMVPPGGHDLFVATQLYIRVDWKITPLIDLRGSLVEAEPRGALKTVGGRATQTFGTVGLDIKF